MARRKGKKRSSESESFSFLEHMKSETLRGVWGIFLIAIAIFLILAAFDVGGFVGRSLFDWLSMLLGVGYALLPISVLILAIVLLRSMEDRLGILRIASAVIFFIASLGLINILFPTGGGIVGEAITTPLVAAVATPASIIFLFTFMAASLLIAFDLHPGRIVEVLSNIFAREEMLEDEDEEEGDVIIEHAVDADDAESFEGEEEEEPEPQVWSAGTEKQDSDMPPITALGGTYTPPPLSLLGKNKGKPGVGDVKANANIIKRTLQNFGIHVEMDEVSIGPSVTRYAMKPAEGVRLTKILALQSNLELALAASPVRIEAPIPGKSLVGIEIPNTSRTTLGLAPLFADELFAQAGKPLLVALGRTITGAAQYADLSRMPHLLIAGATGSGKSVTIHDVILSLLYRCGPDQLRFLMVDPKRVELTLYNSIPHLLTPVITDAKKTILGLKWLAKEMDRRYDVLESEHVRDITSYHENIFDVAIKKASANPNAEIPEPMPYIVVVIDELADIMSTYPRELEAGIVRLAQMSRAVGIHLVLSTQRPSVKVLTGLIKANIPARIALQVSSQIDSRTILDMGGAEKLLGAGDMLFLSGEMSKPKRIQAPFTSEHEVKRVVTYIADTYRGLPMDEIAFSGTDTGTPNPIFSATLDEDDDDDDDLYPEAKQAVLEAGKASTSYLQRKLRIGYARAARLIDILEERGVIGPGDGAKPREVYGKENESYEEEDDEDKE